MDPRLPALSEQLLLLERELRLLGKWAAHSPEAYALASQEPFCVDTLAFEEWLQWVFLPRMRHLVESNAALPSACGIEAMAEVAYPGGKTRMAGLFTTLAQIDRLLGVA